MSKHGKLKDDTTKLTVVLPKRLRAEIDRLAIKERRSSSNYALGILEDCINEMLAVEEPQAPYMVTPKGDANPLARARAAVRGRVKRASGRVDQ
jgi:hypothetical protein